MEIYLQEEIIQIILCHKNLSINDVVHFSLANKYYYNVIRNNNSLWKKKYFQIWPQFSKLFEKQDSDFCWYEELQYVYNLKRKTRETLCTMSLRFYEHYQLFGSHFSEWMKLYEETPRTYHYLVHDLTNVVNTRVAINTIEVVPTSTPGNKTLQYYASKVLRYLLYLHLMEESHVRLSLHTLETAIVFATQWCLSSFDVSWKDIIPNKFDEWAEKVKQHLIVVHPNHPLFAVPKEELKIWREEDIDGNKYDAENSNKVVQALESVLAFSISPKGSIIILQVDVFFKQLTDSDLVKMYGEYRSLLLTYQCVARRLGLKYKMQLTDDGTIFGLQLSSNFSNINADMLQKAVLPIATKEQLDPIKAIYQYRFLRPSQCPGQQFLKLLEALFPFNITSKTFMEECYVDQTNYFSLLLDSVVTKGIKDPRLLKPEMMKILRVVRGCETMVEDNQKVRPPNLKYAVGMVMQHVEGYKCVIYDWDPTCSASAEWQLQNHIPWLEFRDSQPFYSILDEYGRHEYVAQEHLEPSTVTAPLIMVEDIGWHFSHVFETHFVPNEAKEKQYPEDAAVRHMFHQKRKVWLSKFIVYM